jgi:transposase
VSYALGQWESLEIYLQDAQIEIDNNLVENAIRPTALGKNYEQSGIMQSSTGSDRDFCRWAFGRVESAIAPVFA